MRKAGCALLVVYGSIGRHGSFMAQFSAGSLVIEIFVSMFLHLVVYCSI